MDGQHAGKFPPLKLPLNLKRELGCLTRNGEFRRGPVAFRRCARNKSALQDLLFSINTDQKLTEILAGEHSDEGPGCTLQAINDGFLVLDPPFRYPPFYVA